MNPMGVPDINRSILRLHGREAEEFPRLVQPA
jgi:hypothetical protein